MSSSYISWCKETNTDPATAIVLQGVSQIGYSDGTLMRRLILSSSLVLSWVPLIYRGQYTGSSMMMARMRRMMELKKADEEFDELIKAPDEEFQKFPDSFLA